MKVNGGGEGIEGSLVELEEEDENYRWIITNSRFKLCTQKNLH